MKRVRIVLIIILVTLLGITSSYAATGDVNKNIELNLSGTKTIDEDTKSIELMLSLGKFTGIEENVVLGYEATLEYDNNMFETVTVEGLNGWSAEYEGTTKILIGDTATAKSNTNIARIVLKVKEGIQAGTSGKVTIDNILLTDGTNDFTFNKEVTITKKSTQTIQPTVTPDNEQTPTPNQSTDKTPNESTDKTPNGSNKSSTSGTNVDKTLSNKKIPATGIEHILIIAISIIFMIGILCFIRYKTIKLK